MNIYTYPPPRLTLTSGARAVATMEAHRHYVAPRPQAQDRPDRLPLQHLDREAGPSLLCALLAPRCAALLLEFDALCGSLLLASHFSYCDRVQVKLGGEALFGALAAPYMLPAEMHVRAVRPPLNIGVNEREKQDWRTALSRLIETVDAAVSGAGFGHGCGRACRHAFPPARAPASCR